LYADTVGMGGSSSRSRSPSPAPGAARVAVPVSAASVPMQHPLPSHPGQLERAVAVYQPTSPPHPQQQQQQQTLAPPPAAPHGPRLPGAGGISRTPSLSPALAVGELANGASAMRVGGAAAGPRGESTRGSIDDEMREASSYDSDEDEDGDPDGRTYQPSAKALGKRRVEADPYDLGRERFVFLSFSPSFLTSLSPFPLPSLSGLIINSHSSTEPLDDDLSLGQKDNFDDRPGSDEEDTPEQIWAHHLHPATHFVYDAAAERTQQRIRQGHVSALIVNGVH
jgi:hypothetical protein